MKILIVLIYPSFCLCLRPFLAPYILLKCKYMCDCLLGCGAVWSCGAPDVHTAPIVILMSEEILTSETSV
jgi:hypothetical protein